MFLARRHERIEFRCAKEDFGVIAEPVAAKTVLPNWFVKLPPVYKERLTSSDNGITIKRCMPFLDAMMMGWIIPLAASVRLDVRDGGKTVTAGWEFDKIMVSHHHAYQAAGNPLEPRPPCKFHNYWTISTPKGWSCLLVPPLNRSEPRFQVLCGVVDTDTYQSPVHFPFMATAADGVHEIEKGTPLVQVIPFPRSAAGIKADVRAETEAELKLRECILRNTQAKHGWYREEARSKR
jgi:hypothetical protein